jgi:hypothetical protein
MFLASISRASICSLNFPLRLSLLRASLISMLASRFACGFDRPVGRLYSI